MPPTARTTACWCPAGASARAAASVSDCPPFQTSQNGGRLSAIPGWSSRRAAAITSAIFRRPKVLSWCAGPKSAGLPVTCEVTPHHLLLCEDDIKSDDGKYKMNPPLRSAIDRQALWDGVCDGTIECIATDHAPHTAEEKARGLLKSAMGIVGLETAFAVSRTALGGKIAPERLLAMLGENPRRVLGLSGAGERAGCCSTGMRRSPWTRRRFSPWEKARPLPAWLRRARCHDNTRGHRHL